MHFHSKFAVLRLDVAVSIWNRGTREVSMCGFSIGLTLLHGARFRFLPCSLCSLFWLCSLSLSLSVALGVCVFAFVCVGY